MSLLQPIEQSDITKALEQLAIQLSSQEDVLAISDLYKNLPNNVEVKLCDACDPEGTFSFISEQRIISIVESIVSGQQISQQIDPSVIQNLSESVQITNIEIQNTSILITLNEPIGRALDPDLLEFINKLGELNENSFIVEFNPTESRLLEIPEKSEAYKQLHGYPDLEFPDYLTINRSARRVFSKSELRGLQNAMVERLKLLGISEKLISLHEQDCTVTLPKNSPTAKWIYKFAPRLFPFSHLGLSISFVDKCPEEFTDPTAAQLLSFACGRPVIQSKISNRYTTLSLARDPRDTGNLFKDISSEYKKLFGSSVLIVDLSGSDMPNEILKNLPYAIRSSVFNSFSSLGLVTSELPSVGWSDSQLNAFEQSLDLTSWQNLPNRPNDSLVIAIDPPDSKAEVGFSVKPLESGGYEVCGYVLNISRLMPVYSSADDILFENCLYIPGIGMYPYQIAETMSLSESEERPLICVKTIISPDGSCETDIFECKGKLDYKLSTFDAARRNTAWSNVVSMHRMACKKLSESEAANNRIPINEYEYDDTYELHMLIYSEAGKWCAQRKITVPFRVTDAPRARDDLFTISNSDPRLRSLSNRTGNNLRRSLLDTIWELDQKTREELFLAIRAKGYFSTNSEQGHWFLGLQNYIPLGGALRRDPIRLALHNITEYLNGHQGLSNHELDVRLKLFNAQQNLAYQAAISRIKEMRLKSVLIGTVVETTVEQILGRNSTQEVKCADGRSYEIFHEDRIPIDANLKIKIIAYNPNNNMFRGQLV